MKKTVLTRKAHGAVSRGLRGLCLIVAAWACTAQGSSVFDDAMAWWKFDRGGAAGTVATKAQLGDARSSAKNQPSELYGLAGGPIWSEMDVRMPYQRRTVHGTALHFPCETRMNGTTPQCWYTSLAFSDLYSHDSELTIVARVRIEANGIQAADAMIWNNAYTWGAEETATYGSAMGIIKYNWGEKGSEVTYGPYGFVGRNMFGNDSADRYIPMKVGEWYDVAYLISEETVDGTRYDVVTFVVGDASGIRTQTTRKPSNRVTPGATAHARMGAMNYNSGWVDYDAAALGNNKSDNYKGFDGWMHQLAVWKRVLTIDEVKEAFGRPAEYPEQDIYAEAVNWIRFDKDFDGNGKVTADEVRDVRHWNAPSNGQPVVVSQTGPLGGPIWTNMTVDLPGRGVSIKSPCLYFPIATNVTQKNNETVYQCVPTTLRIGNMMRAGSYTIMARIYPLWQPCGAPNVSGYFYNNGLDWERWEGSEFGFTGWGDKTGNSFRPVMTVGHGSHTASDLIMYTNNWYDIAFSIKDNGFDAAGNPIKDTAIVAIQDVAKGFRYQTLDISTNAYSRFSHWVQRAMLGSEVRNTKMTDYYNASTGKAISNGNAVKAFNGMIHEVVVWNRALTTNEIKAAFNHPCNMVMQAGTADGSASEFAGTDGAYDCNVDTTGTVWRAISSTLNADHPELTLRFTPEKNNVKFVHYLHLKSADVGTADGQKARLKVLLNDRAVDEATLDVGAFEDRWLPLPRKALKTGGNVLKIAYVTGGSAASFALDSVEITGAWQAGIQDGGVGEFSQEGVGNVTPNYVVGDRNFKHVCRAVTSGWFHNYHSFYVPAYLATNHAFRFTSAFSDYSAQAVTNEASVLTIDLNGAVKYKTLPTKLPARRENFTFEAERGELKPGWNTIHYSYTGTAAPAWLSFDFFRLEISDYHTGIILLIR